MNVAVAVFKGGFPLATRGGDGFGLVDVDFILQAIPGERAIHGAGVDVGKTEGFGDQLGVGALAAGAGAINGYDNRMLQNYFILRQRFAIAATL